MARHIKKLPPGQMVELNSKIPVAILGATGMVGQRFVELLIDHPWFEITGLAASPRSKGKPYVTAMAEKNTIKRNLPEIIKKLIVKDVESDMTEMANQARLAFSALDMDKAKIKEIENAYAGLGVAVVSNNSAHRWTEDVPMMLPEINHSHTDLIDRQRKNRGWNKGLIVVKPNCSIQSYVPALAPLRQFTPLEVMVSTYQALSGAGKTLESWPEMKDNVIPFIAGEEEKSEKEPLKIWGAIKNGALILAENPKISAQCIRVPISDGHLATISVKFKTKPSREQILEAWQNFKEPLKDYELPSSPAEFLHYFSEDHRPQTALDRDNGRGMTISLGRLREDPIWDWKFVALSHNTIRGAAGGAILTAELLVKKGYV